VRFEMSRHTPGPTCYAGPGRPGHHGTTGGEAFPKRVPSTGCGFSGLRGDFPPEKLKWYDQSNQQVAAGSRSLGKGKNFGPGSRPGMTWMGSSFALSPSSAAARRQEDSRQNLLKFASQTSLGRRGSPNLAQPQSPSWSSGAVSTMLPVNRPSSSPLPIQTSHQMLHYGTSKVPELLKPAGLPSFEMRRFHETSSSGAIL